MKSRLSIVNEVLNEASVLYVASNFRDAEVKLRTCLELAPQTLHAQVMLGVIYARTKRPQMAIDLFEAALDQEPEQFDSLFWMAMAKKALGMTTEAVGFARRTVSLHPSDPAALNSLGMCLLANGEITESIQILDRLVRISPGSAAAFYNFGLAVRQGGERNIAMEAFEKAIGLNPRLEDAYFQLVRLRTELSDTAGAVAVLENAVRAIPHSKSLRDALAVSYCRNGQESDGESLFRELIRLENGFCRSYALWLQEVGRREESIQYLLNWVDMEPVQGMAYFALAEAGHFTLRDGEPFSGKIENYFYDKSLPPIERMYIAYSLGKAYESGAQYERSIRWFDTANQSALKIFSDNKNLDHEAVNLGREKLIHQYSKFRIASIAASASPSTSTSENRSPIFIVGMIRCGSTLLDRLLSQHPEIASAGELHFWPLHGPRAMEAGTASIEQRERCDWLAQAYLRELEPYRKASKRVIDKQPLNYEWVGLIHSLFPNAHFIHLRRNPVDTCVSIYTTHFGGGPNFAYHKENITFAYRHYLSLMEHWRSVIPPTRLMEIDYEVLVEDPDKLVRQIVQFCGLTDANHRANEETGTRIATPSRSQARKPVYATSVNRWKRFEPWLGSLADIKDLTHPSASSRKSAP